jgi:hypothetical protein
MGHYYVGHPSAGFAQIWSDADDFWLPRAVTAPAVTRVDAGVAFGQGQGFRPQKNDPPVVWWPTEFPAVLPGWVPRWPGDSPPDNLAAVIWKGYIRLPEAGTYYFGTISDGPSAVYLNQARVALNGDPGGALVSDDLSYADGDSRDFVQNLAFGRKDIALGSRRPEHSYLVPVPIDGPRDLPIEVRYNALRQFSYARLGIDLFWVTPQAPRDSDGKPMWQIVPSGVLYTAPPGPVGEPAAGSATSAISADHLYFPAEYTEEAVTLTIRLADEHGNPAAGKHVHVSSVADFGGPDVITQPEAPTDQNGETTAQIRGAGYPHDSAIFATDMTDLVDVAQVAHVRFEQVASTFFTDAFSPYYDQRFSIEPLPPVAGRPAVISTGLKNRSGFPAAVSVTFLTTAVGIGLSDWVEIAKVDDLVLQPGESRVVQTTFTPAEVMDHKCYKVEVTGTYIT